MDNLSQQSQVQLLLLQELQALHHLLPLANTFTQQEEAELKGALSHPTVVRFFKVLANNAVRDIMMNDFEAFDAQPKILARYNKLKGIIMVCHNILLTYDIPASQSHQNQRR